MSVAITDLRQRVSVKFYVYILCVRVLKEKLLRFSVDEDCTAADLKGAFVKLAKDFHPDSGSPNSDANKFSQVEQAYRSILVRICRTYNV